MKLDDIRKFISKRKSEGSYFLYNILAQLLNIVVVSIYISKSNKSDISDLVILNTYGSFVLNIFFLRNEQLIVSSKTFTEAKYRIIISIIAMLFISAIIVLFYYLDLIQLITGLSSIVIPIVFLILLSLQGLFLLLSSISNFARLYSKIGLSTLIGVISSIVFFTAFETLDLNKILLGLVINQLIACFFLLFQIIKSHPFLFSKLSIDELKSVFLKKNTIEFSFLGTPLSFLNTTIIQFPVLFLAGTKNEELLFLYFIFQKFIQAPLSLIFNPLSQILHKEFSTISAKSIGKLIRKWYYRLFRYYPFVIPLSTIYFTFLGRLNEYPNLFYLNISFQILLFANCILYLTSSFSTVILSKGAMKYELLWKIPSYAFILTLLQFNSIEVFDNLLVSFSVMAIVIIILYGYYALLIRHLTINLNN